MIHCIFDCAKLVIVGTVNNCQWLRAQPHSFVHCRHFRTILSTYAITCMFNCHIGIPIISRDLQFLNVQLENSTSHILQTNSQISNQLFLNVNILHCITNNAITLNKSPSVIQFIPEPGNAITLNKFPQYCRERRERTQQSYTHGLHRVYCTTGYTHGISTKLSTPPKLSARVII